MAQNFNVGCASAVALLQAQVKGVHGLDLQSGALNGIPFAIEVETQLQKYRASVEDINKHSAAGAREGVVLIAGAAGRCVVCLRVDQFENFELFKNSNCSGLFADLICQNHELINPGLPFIAFVQAILLGLLLASLYAPSRPTKAYPACGNVCGRVGTRSTGHAEAPGHVFIAVEATFLSCFFFNFGALAASLLEHPTSMHSDKQFQGFRFRST
eukprot:1158075-Pelagomonas_calceolata.AAC.1